MNASPFRTRTVVVLAAACGLSLLAGFAWSVFGPEIAARPSSGSDAYSRSAVGHRAFVETLEAAGIPVETSRASTAAKAARASLVVLAEPDVDSARGGRATLADLLATRAPVLLALPKWRVVEAREGRVERVDWEDARKVDEVLHAVDPALAVVRDGEPESWTTHDVEGRPELRHAQLLARSSVSALEPLVETNDGSSLAAVVHREGTGDVTIVADPDLLENHGLHRGDNAPIAVALVARARVGDGPVVVDETLHGHAYDPSVFRELFRWPLVLATAMAAVAAAVWLWAGMGRFGAPRRDPREAARATRDLVERTADLLHRGGHGAHVLSRYLASAVQDVARATQAPPGASGAALDEWLAHLEGARRPTRTLAELRSRVADARTAGPRDARRLVTTATAIHAWRREMTHGAVGGP